MALKALALFGMLLASQCTAQDSTQPPVLPQALSSLITSYKPLIASLASTALPATVGNCSAVDNPPKPCTNIGNLFANSTSLYNIEARWISGLNSLSVDTLQLTPDTNGSITLDAAVTFKSLPLSLKVEACLPKVGCTKVADDTATCCGSNKTISMTITATCSETFPYLQNLTISKAKILPSLDIVLNLMGTPTNVYDATNTIESAFKTQGTSLLASQGSSLVNDQLKNLYGSRIFCTEDAQKKWLAANPPASTEPAATAVPKATTPASSASIVSLPAFALLLMSAAMPLI
ncbi:hypothetical protein AC1031_008770 [Aphanomyces cochlioides]|nr:hypothetical protein AC1031_008770 [Aphanomyces cochlioides]